MVVSMPKSTVPCASRSVISYMVVFIYRIEHLLLSTALRITCGVGSESKSRMRKANKEPSLSRRWPELSDRFSCATSASSDLCDSNLNLFPTLLPKMTHGNVLLVALWRREADGDETWNFTYILFMLGVPRRNSFSFPQVMPG